MGRKRKQKQKQPPQKNHKNLLTQFGLLTTREDCDQFSTITGNTGSFGWPQLRRLVRDQLLSPPSLQSKSAAEDEPPAAVRPAELYILVPRCGSSKLSEYLVGAGFQRIMNVDFSEIVNMDTSTTSNGMKCRILFADKTLDAIVDEGGLDALMVLKPKSSSPPDLFIDKVKRILKDGGKYICLTKAEPDVLGIVHNIIVALQHNVHELSKTLKSEQEFRSEYSKGFNKLYSVEDLKELEPGRRKKVILGDPGGEFFYKGVLADAQQDSGSFSYQFAVYIVAQNRVDEWLFSSEEGQEKVVAKSEAARLLIIFDSNKYFSSDKYMERELNHLARQLAPRDWNGVGFRVMMVDEVITMRDIVHQITTAFTGPIIVDEVNYNKILNDGEDPEVFRRLTFKRSVGMVESEALLYKGRTSSKTRKKGKQKKGIPLLLLGCSSHETKVDHNYLAQPYQNAIICGLLLISPHLIVSSSSKVKTMVIGLGGGSLPMFMKKWLPDLSIEVAEIEIAVLGIAKDHFGFTEDKRLKVRIGDGVDFVRDRADSEAEGDSSRKLDVLIVDVNLPNPSSGAAFVKESFLQNAKKSLSEKGLFVINVVCWSSTSRAQIYSRLEKLFGKTLHFKGDDGHEVVFALKNESEIMTEDGLYEACKNLEISLEKLPNHHKWIERVIEA